MKTRSEIWFPYIAGIMMATIFGHTFIFTKRALQNLTPMVLLSYRFFIAAILLTFMYLLKIVKLDYKDKPVKGVFLLSIFYPIVSFIFETVGIQYTSTSQAGIIVSLMPIFVMMLSIVFLKEKPAGLQVLFIIFSVIGVLITIIFSNNIGIKGSALGVILLIISVFAGSIHNILSRKYSRYFTPIEITFIMIWTGAVFFTGASVIQGLFHHNLYELYILPMKSITSVVSVLYLSILASVVAFFAMNYSLSKLPAANVSVFNNLATVISILAGIIIEKESLFWYQVVGGILIILGVWGTNYFEIIFEKKNSNKA